MGDLDISWICSDFLLGSTFECNLILIKTIVNFWITLPSSIHLISLEVLNVPLQLCSIWISNSLFPFLYFSWMNMMKVPKGTKKDLRQSSHWKSLQLRIQYGELGCIILNQSSSNKIIQLTSVYLVSYKYNNEPTKLSFESWFNISQFNP